MKILISFKLPKLEKVKLFEKMVNYIPNSRIELDITKFVSSEDFTKFIPLIASEIEDYLGDRVEHVKMMSKSYIDSDLIERVLNLLDYLNVSKIVLKIPENIDNMIDIIDTASRYGIKTIWKISKVSSIEELNDIANNISPYRLRLAIDVASRRSVREFTKDLLTTGGYLELIYLDNKTSEERGIPIFSSRGRINFAKIFKILRCVGYDRDLVLNYRPKYYNEYSRDVELAELMLLSIGSKVVDKLTRRLVEDVIREMMNF